jgi:hypothetical protein
MELVKILRDLWRLRVLVGCAALVAILVGVTVAYRMSFPPKLESRKYDVGVATARILVDTPSSQVVEVAPKGSDTLGVRANLLASLMVDGVVKDAIAQRAGLRPDQLEGVSGDEVPDPTELRANVLTTRVMTNTGGEELPIIEIEAQSANATGAARLANAAVAGLRDYLDSQAAAENVANKRRLRISGLGGAQARQAVRGPKTAVALAATIFLFLVLNGIILGGQALIRGWRAAEQENLQDSELVGDDERLLQSDALPGGAWSRDGLVARDVTRSTERSWSRRPRPALASGAAPDESRSTSGDDQRAKSA